MIKTKPFWDDFAETYDMDFGYSKSVQGDIDFYLKYARKLGSPILDMGCGTGRISIPLVTAGFQVEAVDISPEMIKQFKRKLKTDKKRLCSNIYICDGLTWNNPRNLRFKMIILPFDVFLHFTSRRKQEILLKRMVKWLDPKGVLIIDVFQQRFEDLSGYKDRFFLDGLRKIGKKNVLRFKQIKTDFDSQINNIEYIYLERDSKAIEKITLRENRIRYITKSEGFLMLEKAGYTNIKCYGGYNGQRNTYDSKRMIFFARKAVNNV